MTKKLNDEKFNAICESYGLIRPTKTTVECYWTLPKCRQSYKSFARKEYQYQCEPVYIVCCGLLYDFDFHTFGARNSVVVNDEEELHKALTSMMKEYHELIKNERKRKIEEL